MQHFRKAHHIIRFMLVWFALYLSAAIASPLVNPTLTNPHCISMAAMEKVGEHPDGDSGKTTAKLDCPLCLCITAPPATGPVTTVTGTFCDCVPLNTGLSYVPRRPAIPPAARGPPAVLPGTLIA